MFNLDLTVYETSTLICPLYWDPQPQLTDMFKLVYFEASAVGKRAMGIFTIRNEVVAR